METQGARKKYAFFVLLIVLTGLVLRLYNIDQSFWWNEINDTLQFAFADTLWQTISRLGHLFNNHVLYSLLCRLSAGLFGETETAARLPALLMGMLSIALLYRFGRVLAGPRQGLISAYLLAISALHINHSMEARGYTGFVLFALLSSFAFLGALRTNNRTPWLCFVLFTVLGMYMHLFMIFVVASQLLYVAALQGSRLLGRTQEPVSESFGCFYAYTALSALLVLLLYSPIIWTFMETSGKLGHYSAQLQKYAAPGYESIAPFVIDVLEALLPGSTSFGGGLLYAVLFFAGLLYLSRSNPSLGLYILILVFLPPAFFLLIEPTFLTKRYFIYCLPFIFLVLGCGIVHLRELIRGGEPTGALCITVMLAAVTLVQIPQTLKAAGQDRQNYREAVRYVYERIQDPRESVLFAIGYGAAYFSYYSKTPIAKPATYDEFIKLIQGKKHTWCLITAWLPEMHPSHEEKTLYRELPEQEKIYAHVIKHFKPVKSFLTEMPTHIYLLEQK